MRKFISFLVLVLILATSVSAYAQETKGDDLFPWPWGTECPFPWEEIEGVYQVQSKMNGEFSRHYLVFEVKDSSRDDLKFLNIRQYDFHGILYSEGRGYSQKDQRVVKGLLTPTDEYTEYSVIVRSYVKDTKKSCRGANLVTAVTFCPLRGQKCLEDSNYLLRKMKTL